MTGSPARASGSTEDAFLEKLRARYEREGYDFVVAPDPSELPGFLGTFVPDALARKPGSNVAVAVKRRDAPTPPLQQIRRLFENRPDWQLDVALKGADPMDAPTIPPASPAAIGERVEEVRALQRNGQHRAAFVLAWALLEAALRSVNGEATNRPRDPATVLQALAMRGLVEPAAERRLRPLVDLRNRILHGDVDAEPEPGDVATILSAVCDALSTEVA